MRLLITAIRKVIIGKPMYVLGHNKCHNVRIALVEQDFIAFNDREKVTFLLDGIKCDTLDSVISVVSGGAEDAC